MRQLAFSLTTWLARYFGLQSQAASIRVERLFFVALAVGVVVKIMASSLVTLGYDDYRLSASAPTLDLGAIQERVLVGGGSLAYTPTTSIGPVCTDTE